MSLLTMVQRAAIKCGLPEPALVMSSTDKNIKLMRTLADEEGDLLSQRHDWQAQKLTATHTTLAAQLQGTLESIAPGFHAFVDDTMWNNTEDLQYMPIDDPRWAEWQGRPYGRVRGYRIAGGNFYLLEAPAAGEEITFEYVTRYYCQDNMSTAQEQWATDNDTGILSEKLMGLGLVWRWREAKGLDHLGHEAKYHEAVAQEILREGGRATLNMAGGVSSRYFANRGVRVTP